MPDNDQLLIQQANAVVQPVVLNSLTGKIGADVSVEVLRLDKIHPVVSGNKWFKLKNYLKDAIAKYHTSILTYGGAWSNHIVATAFAAQHAGLKSTGLIRGEEPRQRSHTLLAAASYGMDIHFTGRSRAAETAWDNAGEHLAKYDNPYVIPEGGAGKPGVEGCSEILSFVQAEKYSHIMCCIGSGTMYAGIINASLAGQQVIGISVLKGLKELPLSLLPFLVNREKSAQHLISEDYHFGGYAKKTSLLLEFMNHFYEATAIPSDFVYTGKLFYACTNLIRKDYFPKGSSILLIHSGGLQGNSSLPPGTLKY